MALEAVVFSEGLLFGSWAMAAAPGGGWSWGHGEIEHGGGMEGVMNLEADAVASSAYWEVGASSSVMMQVADQEPGGSSAPPPPENGGGNVAAVAAATTAEAMSPPPPAGRRKRRRTRSVKNREEVESQRMTHIAVERNRRKQMNEYLAVLRSLMPPSYVQRGDQASIIGGAINYVKELEQLLQSLEARKHARRRRHDLSPGAGDAAAAAGPFAGFFTFPQYSMSAAANTPLKEDEQGPNNNADADGNSNGGGGSGNDDAASGSKPSAVAEVEVTMVESHASLKLLSRRRPRQLLRLVAGLQSHRLTVLHLNATSEDAGDSGMALYSLSLKVEDDCALSSVDDIAAAVHRIVEAIDREEEGGAAELRSSQTAEE
ncbi:unnamed protein product [Urochloa humidicola]